MISADSHLEVRTGVSFAKDEAQAVEELFDQIDQPGAEAVIFFCSSAYELDRLGGALKARFPCPLIGCTTAGEITSAGYHKGSLTGVSLGTGMSPGALKVHPRLISPLRQFSNAEAGVLARSIQQGLVFSSSFNKDHMFGLLLVDGMSMLEELTIAVIHRQFEGVPVIGGSAGDDLKFKRAQVYADGHFISDAAMFTLIETTLPFYIFKTQHFQPTDKKVVITKADPANRQVFEIDGEPAALAYARILGLEIDQLNPSVFCNHPLMLRIGGEYYVRSIQKANEDGSLTFFCAIANGLVLTVANGVDFVKNLKMQLSEINRRIPHAKLILGCDCILRRLEVQEKKIANDVRRALEGHDFVGFSTYGEQFNALHVNQTLTGVAIGDRE